MPSLRVGVISYDWYPYEVRALRMAEAAADAGYAVDVICLRNKGAKSHEVLNGVHVYRLPMSRGLGGSLLLRIVQWCWFMLLAGGMVVWHHLRRPYDVVHVHNMPDFLVFAALIPKLLGAKVILDVQDVSPELMGAKAKGALRALVVRLAIFQEKYSCAFAHHVVTTGSVFEEALIKRGLSREKVTSIHNSADPRLFPAERRCLAPYEASQEKEPFTFMYHGTLEERNGLDTAIRAIVLAHHVVPHVRLDIQGRGSHLPFLKQLVIDLDAQEYVAFRDASAPDKLVDFVVHGDAGIIPYRCDGFAELVLPTKAYEFAWMQRPMIGSDTLALRSMFRAESIMLCDPASPESFAEAIIDLYEHQEKRAHMVESAFEDYQPYRWEVMARQYQVLLLELCGKQVKEQSVKEQYVEGESSLL
jgi:glycosyltransferase involved in cell wall biosynthesis